MSSSLSPHQVFSLMVNAPMGSAQAAYFVILLLLLFARTSSPKNLTVIELGSSISPASSDSAWLSDSGHFAFGFYPQGVGYAIGIWLVDGEENTTVWTANRDDPPVDANSKLVFAKNGSLILRSFQGQKPLINLTEAAFSASLLDSGNLVFYKETRQIIWQSFDFPTNTILCGQNLSTGRSLISSKSSLNDSSGRFRLIMQADCNLVAYPTFNFDEYWGSDTWGNGSGCILQLYNENGAALRLQTYKGVTYLTNTSHYAGNRTMIYRATLGPDGNFGFYSHHLGTGNGSVRKEWSALSNPCDARAICGFNSYCKPITRSQASCYCFPGFDFTDNKDHTSDCFRNFDDEEGCQKKNPTLYYTITILAEFEVDRSYAYMVMPSSDVDCRRLCLEDCTCAAALLDSGQCHKFKLPLLYGKKSESPTTFFIKNRKKAHVEDEATPPHPPPKIVQQDRKKILYILIASLGSLTFLCSVIALSSFLLYRHQVGKHTKLSEASVGLEEDISLRSFSFSEIEKSTNGFKEEIGRGSMGTVYKGFIAEERKTVAVKKLENPVEGEREFRRVMAAIGQTHHRNLVRLLGFCVEASRKLLVYEYMGNGSLADILFKAERHLPWKERMRIALDVARGILYLHEECESQIIHCNIKPRNILLDDAWTAKISDLSVSKLLMPDQTGTYGAILGMGGYLAPECEKNGAVTAKADVYSFGVVLLEIVCCRSHMEVNVSSPDEVLLSTWVPKCLTDGQLDKLVREEVDKRLLERVVKVALLCIQNDTDMRPPMKNVMLMLEGTIDVPAPPFSDPSLANS